MFMALKRIFLSTLSLRRATVYLAMAFCGTYISIHALLAESDRVCIGNAIKADISIHALLAESDLESIQRYFTD